MPIHPGGKHGQGVGACLNEGAPALHLPHLEGAHGCASNITGEQPDDYGVTLELYAQGNDVEGLRMKQSTAGRSKLWHLCAC